MNNTIRDAFEAWATGQGVSLKRVSERENATYTNYETYLAYHAWQAAAAAQDARIRQLEEALKETAQSLAWLAFGECRGFSEKLLTSKSALDMARAALKEQP